ncbi:hypothetical protein CEXT_434341 [Caerostris extrusa]|uniref:Uncharacterized protein n=1 Tax=Caerostris extrusa TaxID=172846 RepID=A0AAV4WXY2_CAEEX|nr:hypothetical protein CEXT_434341 [Caerostris extrusa]
MGSKTKKKSVYYFPHVVMHAYLTEKRITQVQYIGSGDLTRRFPNFSRELIKWFPGFSSSAAHCVELGFQRSYLPLPSTLLTRLSPGSWSNWERLIYLRGFYEIRTPPSLGAKEGKGMRLW